LFWCLFWLLNGGDKFFDGKYDYIPGNWSTRGIAKSYYTNQALSRVQPMDTYGLYGVNRQGKFRHYFKSKNLPEALSILSLFTIAYFELLLGLVFLFTLFSGRRATTFYPLGFKLSTVLFMLFSMGDIFFGDRAELWEHGTFLILVLYTLQVTRASLELKKDAGERLEFAEKQRMPAP
jgi:hypothetical protein